MKRTIAGRTPALFLLIFALLTSHNVFADEGLAFYETELPLEKQPITENSAVVGLYEEFSEVERMDEYETAAEYIDRVTEFYEGQPVYFFSNDFEDTAEYDAEEQTLIYDFPSVFLSSDHYITILNNVLKGGDRYEFITNNLPIFEPVEIPLSPEKAQDIREYVQVIIGVDFVYTKTVNDFEGDRAPEGLTLFEIVNDRLFGLYYRKSLKVRMRSITVFNTANESILFQKHTFGSDSPVWDYTAEEDEEPETPAEEEDQDNDSSSGGGGGGCFLRVLP